MLWLTVAMASEWVTVPSTDEDRGIYEARCKGGEPDACWLAGSSWVIAGQPDRAEPLLDQGCMGRSLDACLIWGNLHLTGEVANADPDRATRTLKMLCTQLGPACYELARSGDPSTRADYLAQGCDKGDMRACADQTLDQLAATGTARVDAEMAAACTSGDSDEACVPAGAAAELAGDAASAAQLYDNACKREVPTGCFHDLRLGAGQAHDWTKDHEAACASGDAWSCFAAGDAATACDAGEGLACIAAADDEPGSALMRMEQACTAGVDDGCDQAAGIQLNHDERASEWPAALAHLERACTAGRYEACVTLHMSYSFGIGTEADEAKHASVVERACRIDADACTSLSY